MSIRIPLAAIVAASALLSIAPATAGAAAGDRLELRGVVSGSPYGASGGQMAIPVLFSKMTSRTAGLKSPVGVIILKRSARVKLPNGAGYTVPVSLRTGDRFKGTGTVGDLQRRVFYPRVVFAKPVVYFRSKELSLSELSLAVDQLRKAIAGLQAQLTALRNGTLAGFNALIAEIDALKKQLAALKIPAAADLSGLQAQIDALRTDLNDVILSLQDYAKLTDVDQKIADAIAALDLLTTGDVTTTVNSILNTLNFDTTALTQFIDDTVTNLLADPAGALTLAVNGLVDDAIAADVPGLITTALADPNSAISNAVEGVADTQINAADLASQADLDTAEATITDLQGDLATVCNALEAATVTIPDLDGIGPLSSVNVPVTVNTGGVC